MHLTVMHGEFVLKLDNGKANCFLSLRIKQTNSSTRRGSLPLPCFFI